MKKITARLILFLYPNFAKPMDELNKYISVEEIVVVGVAVSAVAFVAICNCVDAIKAKRRTNKIMRLL